MVAIELFVNLRALMVLGDTGVTHNRPQCFSNGEYLTFHNADRVMLSLRLIFYPKNNYYEIE